MNAGPLVRWERKDAGAVFLEGIEKAEAELNNVGAPGYQKALLALEAVVFMLEQEADGSMISGAFKRCLLDAAKGGLQ